MVVLVVTVAVGQDCPGGEIRARTTLANLKAMPRLSDLFGRFGVTPSYLLNYPVATRPEGHWFRREVQNGHCEVGALFEPWNTPPFEANEDRLVEQSPQGYSATTVRNKLTALTQAIEDLTGATPTAHRCTGHQLCGPTLQALERLGYLVDSTPLPRFPRAIPTGWRPRDRPTSPYFPNLQNPRIRGGSRVLILPRTVAPHSLKSGIITPALKLGRELLSSNGAQDPVAIPNSAVRQLAPELASSTTMQDLVDWNLTQNAPCIVLTVRTETLTAGTSALSADRQGAGRTWERLEDILRYLMDEIRATPMGMSAFARHHLRGTLVDPTPLNAG